MSGLQAECVTRPDGSEATSVLTERASDHVVYAVWLRRRPDHDIEPRACFGVEEICAKGGQVGSWVDGTQCLWRCTSWGTWRAQDEGAI